ncbi:MAG: hypothetical protein KDC42_08170 [Ignavibacteriae bacterium]|nr:hypothetical protein [Ignavibacteriota bacterium]
MKVMISIHNTIILFLLFLFVANCYGQLKDTSNLDPRQFIKIYQNQDPNEPIGQWSNQQFKTLRSSLSPKSLLTIEFLIGKIISQESIFGNLSIGAKLNDRKIEVSPYSEVGEKQKIILDARPSDEISTRFLNLGTSINNLKSLIETFKVQIKNFEAEIKSTNASNELFDEQVNLLKEFLIERGSQSKKDYRDTLLNSKIITLNTVLKTYSQYSSSIIPSRIELLIGSNNFDNFLDIVRKLESIDQPRINTTEFKNNLKSAISSISNEILLVLDNIQYFKKNGSQTLDVFQTLIKNDDIGPFEKQLTTVKNDVKIDDKLEGEALLNSAKEILYKLILIEFFKTEYFESNEVKDKIKKKIFSDLLYATIDLEKSTALDGDILEIYLITNRFSNLDNSDKSEKPKPIELPLCKYKIIKVGWDFNISDSFTLVKSMKNDTNVANFTKSIFKPSPGISMLWSYGGEEANDFWNILFISFGVNASYLDFQSDKDVEIGVGPILGFFKNKLFFSMGYNLYSNQGGYYSIGLSFINLASIFSSDKKN